MRVLAFFPILSLAACLPDVKPGVDTGGLDEADDTGVTVDSEEGEDSDVLEDQPATLRGTLDVSLYQTDENGDVELVSWDEATGGVWPFGAAFVAAYVQDEATGEQTWLDSQTFTSVGSEGESFELVVPEPDELAGPVYVWAALDYYGDRILGSGEPSDVTGAILLSPGQVEEDIALQITSTFSFGGGGGPATPITIAGDMEYDGDWAGGECVSLLFDTDDWGPYNWAWFTPSEGEGGVTGSWSYSLWEGWGNAHLKGACDDNLNSLIDPHDVWGVVVEDGRNDNPVDVSASVSGQHLVIPFAGARATVDSSVLITGDITTQDGFETWPSGSTVYVAALRSRPTGDLTVDDLGSAYDFVAITGGDLAGTAIAWELEVPTYKTVYVWAFGDTDGDGNLNEAGEPLGNPGDNGRVTVTNEDESGYSVNLISFEETPAE